jgi:hypothetical protein
VWPAGAAAVVPAALVGLGSTRRRCLMAARGVRAVPVVLVVPAVMRVWGRMRRPGVPVVLVVLVVSRVRVPEV